MRINTHQSESNLPHTSPGAQSPVASGSITQLTNDLLEDLLNPTLGSLELCQLHNLTLPQLAAILESETYKHAAQCIQRIADARHQLLEAESRPLATARLTDLLKTYPETDQQRETQRKAASRILKSGASPSPRRKGQDERLARTQDNPCIRRDTQYTKDCSLNPEATMKNAAFMSTTLATLTMPAFAQSFNVEWGSPETAPPATYAAEGLPGVWNTFNAMTPIVRYPLVGLDGSPIAADIMNIGFDIVESSDNPSTSGDNEALLDDCFTSFNSPIDGCLFIRFLEPGEYKVIMYALAPDDSALKSRLRIDQNTDDPEFVGGQWVGVHLDGISYMSQTATVGADGRLDMHSGLPSGNIRSVLNGIQVIALADLCPADLNGDRNLDFLDISEFLGAYNSGNLVGDLNNDGDLDFLDISAFLSSYNNGCP